MCFSAPLSRWCCHFGCVGSKHVICDGRPAVSVLSLDCVMEEELILKCGAFHDGWRQLCSLRLCGFVVLTLSNTLCVCKLRPHVERDRFRHEYLSLFIIVCNSLPFLPRAINQSQAFALSALNYWEQQLYLHLMHSAGAFIQETWFIRGVYECSVCVSGDQTLFTKVFCLTFKPWAKPTSSIWFEVIKRYKSNVFVLIFSKNIFLKIR